MDKYQVKNADNKEVLYETTDIYKASDKKNQYIIKGIPAYIHRK